MRPLIVDEKRYVYPHFEGSWLNIGGPQRLKPTEVAEALSRVLGHEIKYDPCTPKEFGDYLVPAFGEDAPLENRETMAAGITAFYEYNNRAETKPFEVNTDFMQERLPEVEFETLEEWAARQDWSDEAHRPPAG